MLVTATVGLRRSLFAGKTRELASTITGITPEVELKVKGD